MLPRRIPQSTTGLRPISNTLTYSTTLTLSIRHASSRRSRQQDLSSSESSPTTYIALPDPTSNIRPLLHPYDPTSARSLSLHRRRLAAHDRIHTHWSQNNIRYTLALESFKKKIFEKNQNGEGETREVGDDDMSVFYRRYLDETQEEQMRFNRWWWRENVGLLVEGVKCDILDRVEGVLGRRKKCYFANNNCS
ncbi:hypothetical protein YB2330_001509 [Saitoella coloradoensis]